MPIYHFHVHNGHLGVDEIGLELADVAAARVMGARHLGEVVAEQAEILARGGTLRVEVTDGQGELLYAFRAEAEHAAD